GVDADDLATERVGVVVELGDAVDIDVRGNGPADVSALEVGAKVDQVVLGLLPVGGVSGGKPGRDDRVEVALGDTRPHGTRVHRRQVHLVAEVVHQYGCHHVCRRDLGIPEDVTQVDGVVLGHGRTGDQRQYQRDEELTHLLPPDEYGALTATEPRTFRERTYVRIQTSAEHGDLATVTRAHPSCQPAVRRQCYPVNMP